MQLSTVLTGLAVGILTTLLFTLPPLLDIRGVRPILILRRAVDDNDDPFVTGIRRKITKNVAQIGAAVLILGGLAAIASTLSDSVVVGQVFSLGLVGVLGVLLAASAAVLAGLRYFLSKTRLHLPSSVRHGLANLYRPGNPSAALLAALGMGVMQIMTVYLVQKAVVSELHISAAPNLPNVFLIDITNGEIGGIRTLLKAQHSVTAEPEMLPVVSSRVIDIDGVPASEAKLKNFPRRMLRSISLTWMDKVPVGTKVVEGKWWAEDEKGPVVAIEQRVAGRIGVHVGSHITFAAQDSQIVATVVALTKGGWAACVFASGVFSAAGCSGRAARCLVRGRACGPGACGGVAAGVVCGLSHGDGDQCGAGAGDGAVGGDSDYVCDSVSGGVFDLCRGHYSGEFDCGDAVSADSGGCGAEDAGSDAAADCYGFFD